MIKVGITGGIGSGKSTVAAIFSKLGVSIYNSDLEARSIMENDPDVISEIKKLFGDDIYNPDLVLDRAKVVSIVFSDPDKLLSLNKIVHPAVIRDFRSWCMDKTSEAYVIIESAVLFESGLSDVVDYVINVTAPKELRIKRTVVRDNCDPEQVEKRINNQMDDDIRSSKSDFIIVADDHDLIIPQIINIDKILKRKG